MNEYTREVQERIEMLDKDETTLFESIMEYDDSDPMNALDTMDDYNLLDTVNNDYDLGYYYVEEAGVYDLSQMGKLSSYIDYESFGRDIRLESQGCFTSNGWLEYIG